MDMDPRKLAAMSPEDRAKQHEKDLADVKKHWRAELDFRNSGKHFLQLRKHFQTK